MSCCQFFCFSSRLFCSLFKNNRNPQQLCFCIPTTPAQYKSSSMIAIIVSREYPGDFRFLLCIQGTFCFKPRGIIFIESSQIRWFSRWSSGGGWSGRAIAQRRPRVSKLWWKGLSDYQCNEIAVKAARWEASRSNKKATIMEYLFKKREPDNSSKLNWTRAPRGKYHW
jgi:hypothetical protein